MAGAILYAGVFLYLLLVRTHDVSGSFQLLGDQIRDWRITLGPISELPLTGTPSTAGGTSFGPIYYWVLWLSRVTVGPFTDNLPHAGAIGLSLIQTGADLVLLHALSRIIGLWFALAVVIFAATSPQDLAFSATIWNPVLAVALSKLTMAATIWSDVWTLRRTLLVVLLGWLAIQAHLGAFFVAAPCMGWMLLQPLWHARWREGVSALRGAVEVILVLQIPYLVHHLTHPGEAGGSRVRDSLVEAASDPGSLRLAESAAHFTRSVAYLLLQPYALPLAGSALIVLGAVVVWRRRRTPAALAASVAPAACAVVAFAFWRGTLTEFYWYLPLVPSVALLAGLAAAPLRAGRLRTTLGMVALAGVLALQPVRCRTAWASDRMPEYDALVRGSRQLAKRLDTVRRIEAPFMNHRKSDPAFIYEILGGRVSPDADIIARIDADGRVSYRSAASPGGDAR